MLEFFLNLFDATKNIIGLWLAIVISIYVVGRSLSSKVKIDNKYFFGMITTYFALLGAKYLVLWIGI